jgi:putative flippase GtrA
MRIGFAERHSGLRRAYVRAVTSPLPAQLARFAAVGVANTAITLGAYAVAIHAGVRYLPAGAAAYALGGANGFALNRTWTFGYRGRALPAAARYAAVTAVGVLANLALLRVAVALGVPHAAAEVAAVAPVTLVTFALNRVWAFSSSDVVPPPVPPALVPRRARRGVSRPADGRCLDTAGATGDRG